MVFDTEKQDFTVQRLGCSNQIFSQVRSAVTAQLLPEHVTYQTVVSYVTTIGGSKRTFRTRAFPRTNTIFTRPISAEEIADPPNPYGTNISFLGISPDSKKRRRERDHLGVPYLNPFYAFGLRRSPAKLDAAPSNDSAASLPVIGRTSTSDQLYDISCSEDGDTLRLLMRPKRDPQSNRLRELIVDRTTALPASATIEGNFETPALRSTIWKITFGSCDDVLCIVTEQTQSEFVPPDHIRVSEMNVAFLHVVPTPEPRLMFEVGPQPVRLREPEL